MTTATTATAPATMAMGARADQTRRQRRVLPATGSGERQPNVGTVASAWTTPFDASMASGDTCAPPAVDGAQRPGCEVGARDAVLHDQVAQQRVGGGRIAAQLLQLVRIERGEGV